MITLKTLPLATKEEVFDQVKEHLLKQNIKSLGRYSCKYKSDTGLQCAAGCLIGDDEYEPEMEGEGWDDLVRDGSVPDNHQRLIRDLQVIHDKYEPEDWKEKLDELDLNNY